MLHGCLPLAPQKMTPRSARLLISSTISGYRFGVESGISYYRLCPDAISFIITLLSARIGAYGYFSAAYALLSVYKIPAVQRVFNNHVRVDLSSSSFRSRKPHRTPTVKALRSFRCAYPHWYPRIKEILRGKSRYSSILKGPRRDPAFGDARLLPLDAVEIILAEQGFHHADVVFSWGLLDENRDTDSFFLQFLQQRDDSIIGPDLIQHAVFGKTVCGIPHKPHHNAVQLSVSAFVSALRTSTSGPSPPKYL